MKKTLLAALVSLVSLSICAQDKTTEQTSELTRAADRAQEAATELVNPNTSYASLTLRNQFFSYTGDTPGADRQNSSMSLFQPIIPFNRDNGSKIIFRPLIPIITDNAWNSKAGLGDISLEFTYAFAPLKTSPGKIRSVGIAATLPTGDKDLGFGESTSLGPKFVFGKLSKQAVLVMVNDHKWDIAGDEQISLSTLQAIAIRLPGGGWNYGSVPLITYDHIENDWTIPLNAAIGKTVILNDRPWKFSFEINYYVAQADTFGPEWMFSFNITPVVENTLANWFK